MYYFYIISTKRVGLPGLEKNVPPVGSSHENLCQYAILLYSIVIFIISSTILFYCCFQRVPWTQHSSPVFISSYVLINHNGQTETQQEQRTRLLVCLALNNTGHSLLVLTQASQSFWSAASLWAVTFSKVRASILHGCQSASSPLQDGKHYIFLQLSACGICE